MASLLGEIRPESVAPEWVDPVRATSSPHRAQTFRKANQAYVILKEKAHLKYNSLVIVEIKIKFFFKNYYFKQ